MVVKELDRFEGNDTLARAGRAAEEQMAFYLKRAFAADPSIRVLNGIRLEHGGDAAQMDHLVIHPCGITIVESKSVTGSVRVNDHGEWARVYGSRVHGMSSPLLQAERQASFLRTYAQAHPADWPEKQVGIFVRVAISDGGVINRPKGMEMDLQSVSKADQVPDAINEFLKGRKLLKAMPTFVGKALIAALKMEDGDLLTEAEVGQVAAFLMQHHTSYADPITRSVQRPSRPLSAPPALAPSAAHIASPPTSARPSAQPVAPRSAHSGPNRVVCAACGGQQLQIRYGYSYFYHCTSCKASTPIAHLCGSCGGKEKTRKDSQRFFTECATCGTSRLFHVNRAQEDAAPR